MARGMDSFQKPLTEHVSRIDKLLFTYFSIEGFFWVTLRVKRVSGPEAPTLPKILSNSSKSSSSDATYPSLESFFSDTVKFSNVQALSALDGKCGGKKKKEGWDTISCKDLSRPLPLIKSQISSAADSEESFFAKSIENPDAETMKSCWSSASMIESKTPLTMRISRPSLSFCSFHR